MLTTYQSQVPADRVLLGLDAADLPQKLVRQTPPVILLLIAGRRLVLLVGPGPEKNRPSASGLALGGLLLRPHSHGLRGAPASAVALLADDGRSEVFWVGERQLIQSLRATAQVSAGGSAPAGQHRRRRHGVTHLALRKVALPFQTQGGPSQRLLVSVVKH